MTQHLRIYDKAMRINLSCTFRPAEEAGYLLSGAALLVLSRGLQLCGVTRGFGLTLECLEGLV